MKYRDYRKERVKNAQYGLITYIYLALFLLIMLIVYYLIKAVFLYFIYDDSIQQTAIDMLGWSFFGIGMIGFFYISIRVLAARFNEFEEDEEDGFIEWINED